MGLAAIVLAVPLFETRQFVLHMLSLVAINSIVALGLQLLSLAAPWGNPGLALPPLKGRHAILARPDVFRQ